MPLYAKHDPETDTLTWFAEGERVYTGRETDAELAANNIYIAKGAVPVPPGKVAVGYEFSWNEDHTAVLFDPPLEDVPLDGLKVELKQQLADVRWQRETSGITINSVRFGTDDRSQTKYLALLMKIQQDPNYTVNFKSIDGYFVTMDAAAIVGVTNFISQYVQNCFDYENQLIETIDNAVTYDQLVAIDIYSGWPIDTY